MKSEEIGSHTSSRVERQKSALVSEKPGSPPRDPPHTPFVASLLSFIPFFSVFHSLLGVLLLFAGSRADALKMQCEELNKSSRCPGGRATLRRAALPLTFSALSDWVNMGG